MNQKIKYPKPAFLYRILGAYRRMIGPAVLEIDASGDREEVQEAVF